MAASLFTRSSRIGRFLGKLALFIVLLIAADFTLGKVIDHFFRKTLYGENWSKENWLLSRPCEVVCFGSSRTFRHYIPAVMQDSLGMTVFNAGANGQYVFYAYALEQLMLERYTPKVIILDLLPNFVTQAESAEEELGRMSAMAPYADHPVVAELLTGGQFNEKIKLRSRLYRYNSRLLSLASNYFNTPGATDNGFVAIGKTRFRALHGFADDLDKNPAPVYDPRRIAVLKAFIASARARGALVVLAFSPTVQPLSPKVEQILAWYDQFARETNTAFIKITSAAYPQFYDQSLYSDLIHMNEPGGRAYTPIFVSELKKVLARNTIP
ncbi:MAG TPA: SGNH/GDSL hydrolase family protein [bacterium]|nr:SGNH/GDSL hydrolase family protein [bacterium]